MKKLASIRTEGVDMRVRQNEYNLCGSSRFLKNRWNNVTHARIWPFCPGEEFTNRARHWQSFFSHTNNLLLFVRHCPTDSCAEVISLILLHRVHTSYFRLMSGSMAVEYTKKPPPTFDTYPLTSMVIVAPRWRIRSETPRPW